MWKALISLLVVGVFVAVVGLFILVTERKRQQEEFNLQTLEFCLNYTNRTPNECADYIYGEGR